MQACPASLYVVGLGPGNTSLLAPEAALCLERSRVIVGYQGYIELLDPRLRAGREIIATGMTKETARVGAAIDAAYAGRETALVCSGDPGVYALAGLVLELLEKRGHTIADVPVHIVPGIPAVCAAAALLGAPLTHDFACVSLSDLLTPWPVIRTRLRAAFSADFVTVIYNPRSRRRIGQLEEALDIGREFLPASTPVGVVRNAFRAGQQVCLSTLEEIDQAGVDMFTLLIVGNQSTRLVRGDARAPFAWEHGARMLTPRGYMEKYLPDGSRREDKACT